MVDRTTRPRVEKRRREVAPRKVPKQGRALATFASILDATATLLARDGLSTLTTNHIAERAGVNIGSLYQYFGSKQVIVAALVDRSLETYETSMNAAFEAARRLALHDGFEALVRAHVAALEREARLLRVLLRHLSDVNRTESYRAMKARIVDTFTAYVAAHAQETHVADVGNAARMMVDCVEAITIDALFESGEALAEDPRVHELLCVARRYFLLRA